MIINENITKFFKYPVELLYLLYLRKPTCFTMSGSFSFSFSFFFAPVYSSASSENPSQRRCVCTSHIDDKDYLTLKGASMKDKDDKSKPCSLPPKSPFHVHRNMSANAAEYALSQTVEIHKRFDCHTSLTWIRYEGCDDMHNDMMNSRDEAWCLVFGVQVCMIFRIRRYRKVGIDKIQKLI